jgi:hypothetical protein
MSKIDAMRPPEVSHELIEAAMKRAHRERNEAIRQLFGFGFTVAKDTVRGAFSRHDDARQPSAPARG